MSKHLRGLIWPLLAAKVLFKGKSYLRTTGWVESIKRGYPCRGDGSFIPWMNYPIIDFLEQRLNRELTVFEYGSGYSTDFFARRVRAVISVEYNQGWYEHVLKRSLENVSLIYRTQDVDGLYCRAIAESGSRYNVVVVDGRDRVNCVKQGIEALTEDGIIILDDSERPQYQEALDYASRKGFHVLHFEGIKPTKITPARSSVMYRDKNCLGI